MKTVVAIAVSALLYGTGVAHAADEATNNRAADRTSSAIDVSTLSAQPGAVERGRLNNGMFTNRDDYGHILSDPYLFAKKERAVATTEGASAIEISMFEERPSAGTERERLNNGMFSNRDDYGHILSDPYLFAKKERAAVAGRERAATTAEPATAIELSMFDTQPGAAERGRLNNGMFNSRSDYGHILSDPDLFGK